MKPTAHWSFSATPWLLLLAFVTAALLAACANPGSGPDGGPYDETPPRVVATYPLLGATDVRKGKKIRIRFSEAIKVEKASENVVISPPQQQVPDFKVLGKRIEVHLYDTLQANTTYTIDFSDAVTDVTEGNPLGNFTYYFSTGAEIDSMELSGYVIDAETLEPVKGILVGVHRNLSDTAFTTLPLLRMGRTDAQGHFSIKGIAHGTYRIYAMNDREGTYRYAPGEQMAFDTTRYTPSCFPDVLNDTAWVDSIHYDTIRTLPYTHFVPDNIVLRAFRPVRQFSGLNKILRPTPEVFTAYFSAPNRELPQLKGLNFDAAQSLLLEASPHADTLTYWISDPAVRAMDSLTFTYTYDRTNDSTMVVAAFTDTVTLVPKVSNTFLREQERRDSIKWAKQVKRDLKRGKQLPAKRPLPPLAIQTHIGSQITPTENLVCTTEQPVVRCDTAGIHLLLKVDSTYRPAPFALEPNGLLSWTIKGEWRPGQSYRLEIDSASIEGLMGHVNRKETREFSIYKNEELSALFVEITDAPDSALVQVLNRNGKLQRQGVLTKGHADFYYLKPGIYFLRCIFDRNHNGRWDTGDFAKNLQPEEVFYFPQRLDLRANWDLTQTWTIGTVDPRQTKPIELLKNKRDKQRKTTGHERNIERMKKLKR